MSDMNKLAVQKAQNRLRLAEKQIPKLEAAASHQEFAGEWYFFLIAAKNVYTALEQGSKVNAESLRWYGAKKRERRDDPLLQYLFQARNDDEHGLNDVTRRKRQSTSICRRREGYASGVRIKSMIVHPDGRILHADVESMDDKPILVVETPAHSVLQPVHARGGLTFPPPTSHRGKPLPNLRPVTVASLAVSYLRELVEEASAMAS
jgi:hypothetical protein